MRGALVRLGLGPEAAARALAACRIDPRVRPERLGLPEFACLAERLLEHRRTGDAAGGILEA
jgi:hypothetical protein